MRAGEGEAAATFVQDAVTYGERARKLAAAAKDPALAEAAVAEDIERRNAATLAKLNADAARFSLAFAHRQPQDAEPDALEEATAPRFGR